MISELVYEELSHGRTDLVAKRLELVGGLTLLSANARVDELVGKYCRELGLTGRANADVPHLAYCVAYEIDYLVTWNCAHLANGRVVRKLRDVNTLANLWFPIICTPDELISDEEDQIHDE